jgi:tetratricopeptide (TPR) repeat protein
MNLKKFLKFIFNKTFFVIMILITALVLFFYWGWFEKQYYKGVGMYYVYKGDKAYKHGQLQKAIDFYNKGLGLYPEHYEAHYNLGNIYVVYEDYYAAAAAYKDAIQYKPDFTLARMNLGIISTEKLGDFDEAISQYKDIVNAHRRLWFIPFVFSNKKSERINRGLAYYNMGVAYREKSLYMGDDSAHSTVFLMNAIDAYKNATRILKDDYDSRYNLGLAYHLAGDYQNAGLNYCKAIELKPMDYEAHYNLAILLKHLKMYKEAYKELEKATILVTNDNSDSNTSRYVFDVLNDVSSTLVINDQYKDLKENVDDEPNTGQVTYIHGKIVASDALDRAMLKNFSTCGAKDYFENIDKE